MSTLLQCTSCDSSFNSNLLLEMHRRFCFPIPSQGENSQTHFSQVSQVNTSENTLICHVCNACYEIFDIEKYIDHINNDHNNQNDYDDNYKENEVSDLYSDKDNKMDVDQDFNSQFNNNIQFNQFNHYSNYSQSEDSAESNRQNLIVNEHEHDNLHIENNEYSENEDEDEDEGEVNEAYEVNLALLSSYLIHEKYEKQGKDNDQTQICHICYEKIESGEEIIRLPCFHYYHSNELMTWFKENVKCPECRLDVIDEIRKTANN